MTLPNFQENLRKYAQLAIKYGLNVQPGQTVRISVEVDQADLAVLLQEEAYLAGASRVPVEFGSEKVARVRLEHAPAEILDSPFSEWSIAKRDYYIDLKTSTLLVKSGDPSAFAGIPAERMLLGREHQIKFGEVSREAKRRNNTPWCIISAASPAQAAKVFPELATEEEQVDALWDAIFKATRVYEADPMAAWAEHLAFTNEKAKELTAAQYDRLHYYSDVTDLTVGLAENHVWAATAKNAYNGKQYIANMPSEEIWTAPDRHRIDGYLASTKPLIYQGTIIEDMKFTFKDGNVVDYSATAGLDALEALLATDEHAKSLGEAALVPDDSPISNTGIVFFQTLFDENASCHFAFGNAYSDTVVGGDKMSKEELLAAGLNQSAVHEDFMVGSPKLNIDAIAKDGTVTPLFRDGNWA
ncbi:MAG: aminopeptidase [Lactobacillales bacterium]|jgi:aminopeptidase|nr:aminopeptidase [Lactobacillales bacterium]